MADNSRASRMAKRIQQIVATALEREIRDPRVSGVTITDTRMTGDLHDATVFYTVMGDSVGAEPDYEAAAAGLERVKGQLRKIVGDELSVRFTPTLSFEIDTVPEASASLEAVLQRARERDAQLAEQKKNATPAGDANPYKIDEDE
ncbi:30S ribosome-binding factor RbfA [Corynebacterium renale]|uniref:Ribosome-binding factor A n=1 Tax=Corynebacterium renale TaxID=1724 RepID=A0A2A9DRC5_9CORY|nr:30S ribosome-binding factor RbfA [Corynebacterium renale]PFG28522.1 ribosome-binding factor A [Corynebacterium renale]SQI26260.1 ribosome-binding factor A [Corynebacterium renale]STC96550.1 ribosome-binding factor A [Corynebacterium renale]